MTERSNRSRATSLHREGTVPVPDGYLVVGHIVGAHGLRGEVKMDLYTDYPERFVPGHSILVGEQMEQMLILTVRPHKNHLLLGLEGVDSRDEALDLRDTWIYVAEKEAMALEEDAYWIHEIIGLAVYNEEEQRLGTIADVLLTGANEVYVVETEAAVNRGRELLLPAIADVIRTVDMEERRMTVRLIPGLLDKDT